MPMRRQTPSKSCCFVFLCFCAAVLRAMEGPGVPGGRVGPSISIEAEAEASYVAGLPDRMLECVDTLGSCGRVARKLPCAR